MATTSTPNLSTSDLTHSWKHFSSSLGLILSNTLLNVSGHGDQILDFGFWILD